MVGQTQNFVISIHKPIHEKENEKESISDDEGIRSNPLLLRQTERFVFSISE